MPEKGVSKERRGRLRRGRRSRRYRLLSLSHSDTDVGRGSTRFGEWWFYVSVVSI